MYLALAVMFLFMIFVVATDLGPQRSNYRFWKAMLNAREIMDRIFSVIFLIAVVISSAVAAAAGIYNWLTGGGTSSLVSGAILIIILAICFFSLRSSGKSFRSGERCECRGDCSNCKVKPHAVTSNYCYHNIPSRDRQAIILETLRVLKKGGTFAIHDIFSKQKYGDMQKLLKTLQEQGYEKAELIDTTKGLFMTEKEAAFLALTGSALLVGKK